MSTDALLFCFAPHFGHSDHLSDILKAAIPISARAERHWLVKLSRVSTMTRDNTPLPFAAAVG